MSIFLKCFKTSATFGPINAKFYLFVVSSLMEMDSPRVGVLLHLWHYFNENFTEKNPKNKPQTSFPTKQWELNLTVST